jgi:hypothetical protein
MTTKVKAGTEVLVFKATVASFYEFAPGFGGDLVSQFHEWLKEKGKAQDFLVFTTTLTTEKCE